VTGALPFDDLDPLIGDRLSLKGLDDYHDRILSGKRCFDNCAVPVVVQY
jgi:hypothetical protein